MKKVSKEEELLIKGGVGLGTGAIIVLGAAALISFIIGVFEGHSRPLPCNKWKKYMIMKQRK